MPFSTALSTEELTIDAARDAIIQAMTGFNVDPELVIVFFSPHHAAEQQDIEAALRPLVGSAPIVGMMGESIVHNGTEAENSPALSVWVGSWAGQMQVDVFHLMPESTPDGKTLFGWPDAIIDVNPTDAVLLMFADPYSFPAVELFLPTMNEQYTGLRVIGGMSSNPFGPDVRSLMLNDQEISGGGIGVLLHGKPRIHTVVSQGCRPIGKPLVATKVAENIIQELSGPITPLLYLRQLLEELTPTERELVQRGLLIGLAFSEYRDEFKRGDFLIRNLIGIDPKTGALAVTDRVRRGQTIQFQTRDAAAAHEDFAELLTAMKYECINPQSGLLFTCNGRGTRMFTTPNHDAHLIQETLGAIPLIGMFAAGELGPIGGKNFIHGFTASAVFFEG